VTANGNGKKPTTEKPFIHAWNTIESDRKHLKEFRRQQRAFDNSRTKKEAGVFPKHHTETPIERIFLQADRKMKRIERRILLRRPK
jgi:hypothetical protein